MGRGGARPGAGRKARDEKFAPQLEAADRRIVGRLPKNLGNLEKLADGGFEQVTEVWEPAGMVFVEAPLLDLDGNPKIDANGRPIIIRQPAFPDLEPDTLVCVQRRKTWAAPDRAANAYLVDRAMGKPTAKVEGEVAVNAGDELRAIYEASVAKIYGAVEGESGGDGG